MTNFILDQLAADESVSPAFRAAIKPPQFFQAKCGRRRTFLSQNGADAYDRGWSDLEPGTAPVMDQGPYSDGQWDAYSYEEEKAQSALDARDEYLRDTWDGNEEA